ncbi:hypothetical protein PFISCL1PPCAC_1626, partial [Pristionchus fissidentatus]
MSCTRGYLNEDERKRRLKSITDAVSTNSRLVQLYKNGSSDVVSSFFSRDATYSNFNAFDRQSGTSVICIYRPSILPIEVMTKLCIFDDSIFRDCSSSSDRSLPSRSSFYPDRAADDLSRITIVLLLRPLDTQ